MAEGLLVAGYEIKLGGKALSPEQRALIRSLTVRIPESGISSSSLVMTEAWGHFSDTLDVTQGVELEVECQPFLGGSDRVLLFAGDVTSVRFQRRGLAGENVLVAEAQDRLHRLQRSQQQRTFLDLTESDLVKTLASEGSMRADAEDTGIVYSSICQFGITSLELLQERAARLGYLYWAFGETLFFKPRRPEGGKVPLTYDEDLLALRVIRTAARVRPEIAVRSWDSKTKEECVGASKAGDEKTVSGGKTATSLVQSAFSGRPLHVGDFPVQSAKEAEAMALGRLERSSLGFAVAKGRCLGDPNIVPGALVELDGVPESCRGTYQVANVRHELSTDGYETAFEARRNAV